MKKLIMAGGILVITMTLFLISELGAQVPISDTGPSKCYNNTVEIPCPSPGQPYYGQDGNYSINPPSYTKLGQGGAEVPDVTTRGEGWLMTRDKLTGLIWEMKTDDDGVHGKGKKYTWCDTNSATNGGNQGLCASGTNTKDFITSLNNAQYGGFSDWRLPTMEELRSLLYFHGLPYGQPNIHLIFSDTPTSGAYWSSNSRAGDSLSAWHLAYFAGVNYYDYKSKSYYVRAVRGGQVRPRNYLFINGNGTVADRLTGLMWQQQDDGVSRSWQAALDYAEGLSLGGCSDWRLPTVKELASIVDLSRANPAINTSVFPAAQNSPYWSSTSVASDPKNAWSVNFGYGDVWNNNNKFNSYFVRAVRNLPPSPIILPPSGFTDVPPQ